MKKLLILVVALVVVIVGASGLYTFLGQEQTPDQLAAQPQDSTGQTQQLTVAPDITVYDAEGTETKLSDYFGKPIVLNFWASWCGPCQSEMPDFQEKFLELGDEVQFLMVNMTDGDRETLEDAAGFIARKGYTFPVFYDTASDAAMTYQVYSLPTTYFINAQGYLIAQGSGALDSQTLKKGIDMIR